MSLDFVAIDFETANYFRGSACSVGVVHVENGQVVRTRSQYIYQDEFAKFHTALHGITPEDVADAPTFAEVWPGILDSIGDLPLVAHNAAFDTGVIRDALVDSDMVWPDLTYACTLVASRRTYDLASYRLPFVAQAAGIEFDSSRHHRADADAEVAALVMLDIARAHGVNSLEDLRRKLGLRFGTLSPNDWRGCTTKPHRQRPAIPPANIDANPENPLYGRGVSFTGALGSMYRADARAAVAAFGGTPLQGVSKKTDLLVCGYQDQTVLRPGAERSHGHDKALAIREKGKDLEIIGEDDFLAMLQEAGAGIDLEPVAPMN
jgi:DNA polymerase III epsilon subunit-like protein